MKPKIFFVLLFTMLLVSTRAYTATKPFITRWEGKEGVELAIPIIGNSYKLVIKDANGIELVNKTVTVGFDEAFRYTPSADGDLFVEAGPGQVKYIRFSSDIAVANDNPKRLLEVKQFGDVAWTSMRQAFSGCENMVFASDIDAPDLSKVTDMVSMFSNCKTFNHSINNWNVSKVADMSYMFSDCEVFNHSLSGWDISNVITMNGIFYGATAFNQDLSSWNLTKCKYLGLENCGISVENYSKSLMAWAGRSSTNTALHLNAEGRQYSEAAKMARTKLIQQKHWIIRGDVSEGGVVYGLMIGGVQITTDNINSLQEVLTDEQVLKKGKVKVTLVENMLELELESAELETPSESSEAYVLESSTPITIRLKGTCSMKQLNSDRMVIYATGEIYGNNLKDKLIVTGGDVYYSGSVRNCTLEIDEHFYGKDPTYRLSVDNAIIKARSIVEILELQLIRCAILQPEGAQFDVSKRAIVTADKRVAGGVEIGIVPAVGVTLNETVFTLNIKTSQQLRAFIAPEKATNRDVTWSSNNSAVADVDQTGNVTAKTKGVAIITVTTQDGGHTASCTVNVTVPVTSVTLSDVTLSLPIGTKHLLTASVLPEGATNSAVTWSSNNSAVADVDQTGNVTAKTKGVAIITVTTQDGGHTASCTVNVTVSTAVDTILYTTVSVSPNPFVNTLHLVCSDVRGIYVLLNSQGIVVRRGTFDGNEIVIETDDLNSGLYLLHLSTDAGATKTYSVIKQ